MSNLLEQASLVMIPSGYKEDIVYSVIPTSGAGDLTFTRASNGTRIDSNGNVEVVPWNLVEDSENFGANAQVAITIGSNVTTAPNGTTTADSIIEDGTNNLHAVYDFNALTYVAGVYSLSCYVKKGIRDWVRIQFYDGVNTQSVWANVDTGVLGTVVSPATASIESVGNGWYRINISTAMLNGTGGWAIYSATSDGGTTYTGTNGATALYLWGLQINIGSTAKPYFPTTDRLNVPRLTYQNGGGGCPSLLLEKQSTNLITYSEQFDNSAWSTANTNGTITRTANYGISPDGTQNADRIQFTRGSGGSDYAQIYQQVSTTSGTHTFSCWIKSLSGTPSIGWAYNGSVWDVVTLTNEWVRYTWTTTTNTNPSANLIIYGSLATPLSADFLVWGYQIEASSYATSYIPTTSSSATRVADACYKTGISSLIGQTEGTLFINMNINKRVDLGGTGPNGLQIKDTSGNNVIIIGTTYFTNQEFSLSIRNSGSFSTLLTTTNNSLGTYKLAASYNSSGFVFYVNGVQIGTSATPPPSATFADIGVMQVFNFNNPEGELVNEAILFPTRLTNSELAQLTGNQNYTINQAYESYGVASESPNCVQP